MASAPAAGSPSFPPLVVLDASVWVSGLLPRDVNHMRAKSWLTAFINSGGYFVAPTLLVIETAAAISRVTQNTGAARLAAQELYLNPLLRLEPIAQDLVDEAADLAAGLGLRAGDSLYVAVARKLQLPLVSLDAEQLTRPAGIIATLRP